MELRSDILYQKAIFGVYVPKKNHFVINMFYNCCNNTSVTFILMVYIIENVSAS
jgi:hypothetical protein